MARKPRILCLHGGGSNNDITPFQTAGLKLPDRMECVFLNAPHEVPFCYPGLRRFSNGPFRMWATLSNGGDQWEESLEHIAEFIEKNGPFDGVYGFSQGTAIITDFSHPRIWKEKFEMDNPPWKFAILACGGASFQIHLPKDSIIDMPSFHIFGKRDQHFGDSNKIAEYWDETQRVTHTHSRGHEIDAQMFNREVEMMAKLSKFLDEHLPSPEKDVKEISRHSVSALLSSMPVTGENWMSQTLGDVKSGG